MAPYPEWILEECLAGTGWHRLSEHGRERPASVEPAEASACGEPALHAPQRWGLSAEAVAHLGDHLLQFWLRFRGCFTGSVANIAQGAMQGQLPLSGWELSSQGVEQFGRSEALVSGLHDHLSFLHHVHEFDPHQGVLSCVERFEPQHGPCHPLHCSMILLHNVV